MRTFPMSKKLGKTAKLNSSLNERPTSIKQNKTKNVSQKQTNCCTANRDQPI